MVGTVLGTAGHLADSRSLAGVEPGQVGLWVLGVEPTVRERPPGKDMEP